MIWLTRLRNGWPLLLVLALLALSYWLDQQARPGPEQPDGVGRHDADAIMERFSAMRMSPEGVPAFVMTAQDMRHYPDDDSTILNTPRVTTLQPGQPPLHAVAQRGEVLQQGDEILLAGAVEVLREPTGQEGALTLQTESLHVLPQAQRVYTDRPVQVADAFHTVSAVGLEMDSAARTLKLLSRVRGEYAPQP